MEVSQHGLLEELIGSTPPWMNSSYSNGFNDIFQQNGWNFSSSNIHENPQMADYYYYYYYYSSVFPLFPETTTTDFTFLQGFAMPDLDSSSYTNNNQTPPFVSPEEMSIQNIPHSPATATAASAAAEEEKLGLIESDCKVEMGVRESASGKRINNKAKKIEGQPSKNLMAERRRRKRLNDRLSMLRAIVPKITKMDRTSILGDTIDYVKELIGRINKLKEEEVDLDSNDVRLNGIFKQGKSNEVLLRNSPKFEVERKEGETGIDIWCGTRPGLLLSTVNTLEALGLEIQHCVISSFNDFSMQASCSQKTVASSDDVKEALLRNAGYGGNSACRINPYLSISEPSICSNL